MSQNKEIKKTMEAPIAALTLLVGSKFTEEKLQDFINQFGYKSEGTTGSTSPREITILKDAEGNVLGRKCTVLGSFFKVDRFSKGATMVKEVEAVKAKLYTESKKMEKDAGSLLDEARTLTDAGEKVAKYEEYDQKLVEAKNHRNQTITIESIEGGFATIEDLAKNLGVEVNPAPVAGTEAE